MYAVKKSLSIGLMLACFSPLLAGCDTETHKADKKIESALADAAAQRGVHSEAGDQAARTILESSAKETGGSPATRAQLAAMRAQIQVDAALSLVREIDRKDLELARVTFNLGQMAVQLDTGTAIATGFGKYDPKAAREQIAMLLSAAQGAPDKPTWEYQSVTMPTVAAEKAKISDLEGQIAKLEEEAKSQGDQRDAALKESETESKASEAAKGQESLDHFKKYSALRKQADDLYTQMEATTARTIPLKSDLAVQQNQLEVLDNVIKELTSQQETLDAGWKAIVQQIDAQSALAKQIVGSESASAAGSSAGTPGVDDGATIAEKAARIVQLAAEIRTMRQQAQTDLDDAAKLFGDAYTSAEQARHDWRLAMDEPGVNKDRADVKAAQMMIDVVNSEAYRLREGSTRRAIGALYASEAASVTSRVNMQASVVPVIERSGASVPADIRPGNLAKDATSAIELADEAYKAADAIFTGIMQGVPIGSSGRDLQNAAEVEHILTLYGQSQLARLSGSEPNAQALLKQAIDERKTAVEKNVKLPALPAELTPAPPAPPPATEPAAAPTTEPAAEPTTEPAAPATEPG